MAVIFFHLRRGLGTIAIVFAAGGACKNVQTTPLLTVEEAMEAMKKAKESGYRPATAQIGRAA